MAKRYDLSTSGISSLSIDGVEHLVDPETGYLVVEVLTPHLEHELARRGAKLVQEGSDSRTEGSLGLAPMTEAERKERDDLFAELDSLTKDRIDRRRSLKQLRQMKADLVAKENNGQK